MDRSAEGWVSGVGWVAGLGWVGEDEGWVDRFVGLWCDLTDGRGGSIGSWVHGAISPSRGRDKDDDLTGAILNSTARSLSLSLFARL